MTIGLIFTAVIAWLTAASDFLNSFVIEQPVVSLVSLGVWVVLGLGFGFFVRHVPFVVGLVLFFIYCAFTGLTLAWIFVAYTEATITYALVSTVVLFAIITVFALFTSIDLTRWWMYIVFGILGMIAATVLNAVLFRSAELDLILSVVGVGLFSISTAVTVQKVVKMEHELAPQYHDRAAIIGAMMLYTNFINLFLRLLEIYARSQRNKR
jgi:FtsH-binding integral membrane protein